LWEKDKNGNENIFMCLSRNKEQEKCNVREEVETFKKFYNDRISRITVNIKEVFIYTKNSKHENGVIDEDDGYCD
jgi:hypothetical protein